MAGPAAGLDALELSMLCYMKGHDPLIALVF